MEKLLDLINTYDSCWLTETITLLIKGELADLCKKEQEIRSQITTSVSESEGLNDLLTITSFKRSGLPVTSVQQEDAMGQKLSELTEALNQNHRHINALVNMLLKVNEHRTRPQSVKEIREELGLETQKKPR